MSARVQVDGCVFVVLLFSRLHAYYCIFVLIVKSSCLFASTSSKISRVLLMVVFPLNNSLPQAFKTDEEWTCIGVSIFQTDTETDFKTQTRGVFVSVLQRSGTAAPGNWDAPGDVSRQPGADKRSGEQPVECASPAATGSLEASGIARAAESCQCFQELPERP